MEPRNRMRAAVVVVVLVVAVLVVVAVARSRSGSPDAAPGSTPTPVGSSPGGGSLPSGSPGTGGGTTPAGVSTSLPGGVVTAPGGASSTVTTSGSQGGEQTTTVTNASSPPAEYAAWCRSYKSEFDEFEAVKAAHTEPTDEDDRIILVAYQGSFAALASDPPGPIREDVVLLNELVKGSTTYYGLLRTIRDSPQYTAASQRIAAFTPAGCGFAASGG